MKRVLRSFLLSLLVTILICSPVFAIAYSATITVTNTSGSDYANLPILVPMNNNLIASSGYSSPDMLDTYITDTEGNVLPFMPADDKSLFVVPDLDDDTTGNFIWISGQTAKSSHDIVVGQGGYITTPDNDDLEPHDSFILEMSVYLANTGIVFEKQDCLKLAYNATTEVLTLTVGNEDTPDYTLTATGVEIGLHTIKLSIEYTGDLISSVFIYPNGLGDYENLAVGENPDGTAHWFMLDYINGERPDIKYSAGTPWVHPPRIEIWTSSTYTKDLYSFTDGSIYSFSAVRFWVYGISNYPSTYWKPIFKQVGYTEWVGEEEPFYYLGELESTLGARSSDIYYTNPVTGVAWKSSDLSGAQFGLAFKKDSWGIHYLAGYAVELIGAILSPHLSLFVDNMYIASDTEPIVDVAVPDNDNDWIWYPNPYIEYIKLDTSN